MSPMISGVILAAGTSSRMKNNGSNSSQSKAQSKAQFNAINDFNATNEFNDPSSPESHKLLLPLGEKTVIEHTVDNASYSNLDELIVVTGHKSRELKDLFCNRSNLKLVHNPEYQHGQSTSMKTGITSVSPSTQAIIFFLGDQPFIPSELVNQMIARFKNSSNCNCQIIYPLFQGKRGNPVLFAHSLFSQLMSVSGDRGGRQVMENIPPEAVCSLPTKKPGVLFDLDSPQDYQKAVEFYKRHL
ncbi:nucleotidyltransferase family protein [Natranaerobius thermophilus]|uniref:MobA-like NTP transferase domain-containing protein n=1 Tax=Natranaerobius thermophilus (strain ATCC BAA-1301 / DSM 18059 / JW/NM-WN-LF) TaxID=457570 RepID=B2A7Z9_NATTJ|nr:NTP transferase domain-containing protein [Natranaerobius thermophilus]ACB85771.1 conserved hypothetical protein, possibly involved in molybdenum cofactor biosynthesis [Natranaerobius thermophilus JW/NM-WN-LF]